MTIDKLKELGYSVSVHQWGWKARKHYKNLVFQCIDISYCGLILSYVSIQPDSIQTQENIDDIQIAFSRLQEDLLKIQ